MHHVIFLEILVEECEQQLMHVHTEIGNIPFTDNEIEELCCRIEQFGEKLVRIEIYKQGRAWCYHPSGASILVDSVHPNPGIVSKHIRMLPVNIQANGETTNIGVSVVDILCSL